ncbi:DUF72 domain-containing protein [Stenotrophomonas sp. YIM B06876]|uniref:DUF72 domain-containing protein n=1 Tax=Stenotrophomonas sp. YIM B06876 TaxID=3060211 RepID=UPI002738DD45|nr:DUF72 domain-containing protein [Stenotrophomonas sp. YIM B06876]
MNELFSNPSQRHTPKGVHVGIGGWTYVPWRGGRFYPAGLVQRRELEFASRQLTAIEINSTYYGTQKPATYARWRDETPEDFVFSAKAPKRITAARHLAGTAPQVDDFIGGIAEMGDKLGPLVWQFEAGRTLDSDDFATFIQHLPAQVGGRRLRHALEIRDAGFITPALLALARTHGMALVYTDSPDYPNAADLTADFVYARLMRSAASEPDGYPAAELAQWAQRVCQWRDGEDPAELPHAGGRAAAGPAREVFVYFISAAKERNPAAAMALLRVLAKT